ncbi:hypothetical protein Mal4_34520 [Maioricimonas rarisocia]|uniref:3-keto-alpha-glucoside-1,2-lyase/3-keto-2-hydroxy-glucal hydratase domain-containing protein n=1 Tax=Maioricimonas rarisocia TaxID=2528026 RepID=A0A517Z9F5_9PLAN|nr:DUF1080 domain-containing protein [Maioricimonas rarisocia]QDU39117.1 hypothetical protein Mal4_34520 [Maioricimonas rarisocia]
MRLATAGLLCLLLCASCAESSNEEATPEPEAAAPAGAPSAETTTAETKPAEAAQADEPAAETPIPYHNPLSSEQISEGWISLFDGHTLFGWESNDPGINWTVQEGAITADSGPVGLLLTTVPFADYEFRCEFRMEAGGNSGIFLRTTPKPEDVTTDCYELNIADEHPEGFTTGTLVGRVKTDEPIAGSGEWKSFDVRVEGNRITVQLDGEEILDYTDDSDAVRRSGLIGLQKNAGKIEFRNILLHPLNLDPLFNGEDLNGWNVVPGSESEFTVEEEVIRVSDGPGFLETEGTYGDFVFQAEAISHGDELNSGYFFRAMKGTEEAPSHGYEVQIHNGYKNDDRTQPANAGTGAIFRRVEARRVVPNDHEWFTTTLVTSGPRIAVWVDGYHVVDWEDTREPDENPRRGKRVEPGHISLQGHDPTTDLSFRNLRITEIPEPVAAP